MRRRRRPAISSRSSSLRSKREASGLERGGGIGLLGQRFDRPFLGAEWDLADGRARSDDIPRRGHAEVGLPSACRSRVPPAWQEFMRRGARCANRHSPGSRHRVAPSCTRAVPRHAGLGLRTLPPRENGGNLDVAFRVRAGRRCSPSATLISRGGWRKLPAGDQEGRGCGCGFGLHKSPRVGAGSVHHRREACRRGGAVSVNTAGKNRYPRCSTTGRQQPRHSRVPAVERGPFGRTGLRDGAAWR